MTTDGEVSGSGIQISGDEKPSRWMTIIYKNSEDAKAAKKLIEKALENAISVAAPP